MMMVGDDFKALRQTFLRQLLGVTLLGHKEFVPQLLTRIAADRCEVYNTIFYPHH